MPINCTYSEAMSLVSNQGGYVVRFGSDEFWYCANVVESCEVLIRCGATRSDALSWLKSMADHNILPSFEFYRWLVQNNLCPQDS